MKIVILGAEARYRAYQPAMPFIQQQELVFLDKDSTEAEILAAGADAEVLFVDAITVVSAALMEHMPCLRLIHSEGVAFDRIDLSAARERGIYVCNNKGCNAGAVAEQTVLLILMLLRHALEGDEAVRAGRQMEMKERCMVEGITELSACKVGLVGFGDIARAAAERLVPFGCELYYYTKHRRLPEEEKKYHVTYLPLEELAEKGSRLLLSDVLCGAALCGAALVASSANVYVNTGTLGDREFAEELEAEADALIGEYAPRAQAVVDAMRAHLRRG